MASSSLLEKSTRKTCLYNLIREGPCSFFLPVRWRFCKDLGRFLCIPLAFLVPAICTRDFTRANIHTAKNYIQELQVFWSMLRRFVSQHIAGYRKVGASYTYIQGFMRYDSVTTIMDAATTILYLPTFFLVWGTKKLYLHPIKSNWAL